MKMKNSYFFNSYLDVILVYDPITKTNEGVYFECSSLKLFCIPLRYNFFHLKEKMCVTLELPSQNPLKRLYYHQSQLIKHSKVRCDGFQILTNDIFFHC